MVLIFDGEEGGAHNTWEYLHVIDRDDPRTTGVVSERKQAKQPAPPAHHSQSSKPNTGWALTLAVAATGVLLGSALTAMRRRRRERS
jgi:hypothetical protein